LADPTVLSVSNDDVSNYSSKYNANVTTIARKERSPLYFLIRMVKLLKIDQDVPPLLRGISVFGMSKLLMEDLQKFQDTVDTIIPPS
jgi:hypothetical protein